MRKIVKTVLESRRMCIVLRERFLNTGLLKYTVIVGIAISTGCASMVRYVRCYTGPEQPLQEIAIVTEPNPCLRKLIVFGVDKMKTEDVQSAGVLELRTGRHSIHCMYFEYHSGYETTWTKTGLAVVELDAKAGHVYEIYPVLHTHDDGWYIGTWDVTGELRQPEKTDLARKLGEIVKRNRTAGSSDLVMSLGDRTLLDSKDRLRGFGENLRTTIVGMKGRQVEVSYTFDRYKPLIVARGSDGKDYHLKISQVDGAVEGVLGIRLILHREVLFQPIDSDNATVTTGDYRRVYKEMPDGSYDRKVYKKMPDGSYDLVK